jgi:mannitol-1-phosphate/altronate dehydrogenase
MNLRSLSKKSNNNIFAIHGGGNIGLGLMADIASQSPFNYHIVATSNDKFVKKVVNSSHQLWLQHNSSASNVTHIKNVTIVSRDFKDVVNLYKEASVLAICLTPSALTASVKSIAQGLIERYQAKQGDLKVFVLMNLPNCAEMVRKKVHQEIFSLLENSAEARKVCAAVKFIPTVVDRIVTKISEHDVKKQLKRELLSCLSIDFISSVWLNEQVANLFEDPEKLAEAIQKLNFQFKLFNAEKSFALYAPSQEPEVLQFPAMKRVNDLGKLEAIKNKYINGPHAMIAWLGGILNCETIADAINYPGVKQFIENTMDNEIGVTLLSEYPDLTVDELKFFKELFFERCEASTDDTVLRVGRDPLRKINGGERIRGTIEISQAHQARNSLSGLEFGLAAAIIYAVKKLDPTNPDCQKIKEIFDCNKSYREVLSYSGVYSSGDFVGLDPGKNALLIANVLQKIATLEKIYEQQHAHKKLFLQSRNSESTTKQVMRFLSIQRNWVNGSSKTETGMVKPEEQTDKPNKSAFLAVNKPPKSFIMSSSSNCQDEFLLEKEKQKTQSYVYNYGGR